MFDGWEEKDRVRLLCSVAGLLFGLGWWCFIDAASVARVENYAIGVTFEQYMPGFAGTIALFMCVRHSASAATCSLPRPRFRGREVPPKIAIWMLSSASGP